MRNIRWVVEKHIPNIRNIREFEFLHFWICGIGMKSVECGSSDGQGSLLEGKERDEGQVHILNLNNFNEFIWNWLRMVNIQYRWGNEVYTGRISCKGDFHHNRLSNSKYPQHNNWAHRWLQCRICLMKCTDAISFHCVPCVQLNVNRRSYRIAYRRLISWNTFPTPHSHAPIKVKINWKLIIARRTMATNQMVSE